MTFDVPNNLPTELTSFVGRQLELAAVRAVLDGERLVTLIGPGGVGKTRLAAQVAAAEVARRPGGVWWVESAAVSDPAQVAEVVAAALRVLVEPVQGPVRSLAAQLRDRRSLICLDNCEHVLDGAAELAGALLRSCPQVSVLTTSREPLAVPYYREPGSGSCARRGGRPVGGQQLASSHRHAPCLVWVYRGHPAGSDYLVNRTSPVMEPETKPLIAPSAQPAGVRLA